MLLSEPGLEVAERALGLLGEAGFNIEQAAEIGDYLISASSRWLPLSPAVAVATRPYVSNGRGWAPSHLSSFPTWSRRPTRSAHAKTTTRTTREGSPCSLPEYKA